MEVGCRKLKWWEPVTGLSWQLMKDPEEPSEQKWLVLHQNLQKYLPSWQGPEQGCGWFGGEAPVRRGIEAPDLHPEAIFPGSFLPHSSSLPWSWIRPFPPSPSGYTARPGLSCCVWSSTGPTQQLMSHPTKHGSTYQQLGRPLRWEWGQLQLEPLVVSSISEQRFKVTVIYSSARGRSHSVCRSPKP